MHGTRAYLDNPAFAGRLRTAHNRRSTYERRVVMSDVRRAAVPVRPVATPIASVARTKSSVVRSRPKPTPPRQERSRVLMRQLTKAAKPQRGLGLRHKMRGLALAGLAGVLFVFGVGVGLVQLNTNKDVKAQVKTLAAQTVSASDDGSLPEGSLPSENRSDGGGYWRPTAEEPKRISIPSLDVDARVLKIGVKPGGEIKTPANIFDAGWLVTSARPGEHGATFIDGHVHGPTQPGVFAGIKKLQPGDKINIERGDGIIFTYSVVKTERYDKDSVDMVAGLNPVVPGKSGLNLITCDGRYNAENGYDHRVMVFAILD